MLLLALAHAADPSLTTFPVWTADHLRDCVLPTPFDEDEVARRNRPDDLAAALTVWRRARPDLYATTEAPPAGLRLVPDFAPMETLHVALPDYEDHVDTYVPLLAAASRVGHVRASRVGWPDLPALTERLAASGANLDQITYIASEGAESIWVRDYGPLPVESAAGNDVLDFAYAPDCPVDDAHPTLSRKPDQQVWRSPFIVEGGNLVTDGEGACFATRALYEETGTPRAAMEAHLTRWAGCDPLVWLEALDDDAAPHADMFLTPAPDRVLLLASFDPGEDPANAAIMARNRARLAALDRWRLVDLPTLPPHADGVTRTFNPVLPFNSVLFVPDFPDGPADRGAVAREILATAFPGRTLQPVPVEALLELGGSLHCIGRASR
jgi:agmatine/peptidylarginine deiminase